MNEKTTIQEIIAQKESEWVDEKLKETEHLRTEINNIMKNEDKEKAKQIAEESQILSDFPHDYHSVEYGAMEMAEWKETQMIKKSWEWIYTQLNNCKIECSDIIALIEDFKKTMEEQQ